MVESKIDDEDNSANIIQTYISTKEICENPSLEVIDGFEHETHDVGSDVINVIGETTVVENHTSITTTDETTFKKPFDAPQTQSTSNQRPMAANNAENALGKPTREIISCFMTTGGFISPAREGKLPEAKKPIIIQEDPEPEEIPVKQRTPSPEIVERKHHSNKRDRENKNDQLDASKKYGDDAVKPNESAYVDEENDKEVKLYEVIQTVPEPPPKKKAKRPLQGTIGAEKKLKKMKYMNRLSKMGAGDNALQSFADGLKKGDGVGGDSMINQKLKKKLHKMETLKKKHKQKLGQMPFPESNPDTPVQKQHKKRMSKLSKRNLQAMGLNPNAIEGFAIPPPMDYSVHDSNALQESLNFNMTPKHPPTMKKNKKLSNEPDKQKIKFFKKSLMSKMNNSRDNDMERMMADSSNVSSNDLNHPMAGHAFNAAADGFDGAGQFGQMVSGLTDSNRIPTNIDNLPPSKKQKLLKKLNKPQKEPKIPKIKKLKKDPLAKKERVPKTPKLVDLTGGIPEQLPNMDENPMSKMFLPDEFRPNFGLIDQFPVPGLNPSNPLFQSVRFDLPVRDQMQNYPFVPGQLQNFDFANLSRFKRPNFNDPTQNEVENLSKHSREIINAPSKPFCNVAPLMPPSLLNMEMNQKDDYVQNAPMNEPHSSQKHYQDTPNSSFGSKKSVQFNNPPAQYSDQPYGGSDSPIVINSDEDEKVRSNPSQSPSLDVDTSFGGSEVKRKKVKDKKDKEKKEKKDKDTGVVKVKKKKDKKDKSKNKGEHSKPPKDKSALKKEKREKKKERERSAAALSMDTNDSMGASSNPFYGSQTHSEWPRDSSQLGDSSDVNAIFNTDTSNLEPNAIPKLTLKLAPSSSSPSSRTSRPSTPDFPVSKKR